MRYFCRYVINSNIASEFQYLLSVHVYEKIGAAVFLYVQKNKDILFVAILYIAKVVSKSSGHTQHPVAC